MGRTVSLPASFKITIGMFVTGSIKSPRIFISTSIVISCLSFLYHHFARQAVGKTNRGAGGSIAPNGGREVFRGGEIEHLILRSPSDPLVSGFILPFNLDFKCLAEMPLIATLLDLSLPLVHHGKTANLLFVRDGVFQVERRSIRPRRILEAKDAVIFDCVEQRKCCLEIGFGFAREPDD